MQPGFAAFLFRSHLLVCYTQVAFHFPTVKQGKDVTFYIIKYVKRKVTLLGRLLFENFN